MTSHPLPQDALPRETCSLRWGGKDEEEDSVEPRKPELVTVSNAVCRDEPLTYVTEQDQGQKKGVTAGWQGAWPWCNLQL